MMRYIVAFCLVCGLAGAATAQTVASQHAPPAVAVSSFEWQPTHKIERQNDYGVKKPADYAQNDPLNPERQNPASGVTSSDPQRLSFPSYSVRASGRVFNGYQSSLHLKNVGTKTITAVEWQHVFFTDKDKQKELRRYKFRKKTKVEPGKQKFLAQRIHSESYSELPTRQQQSVVIDRIEYSDGSVWQRE